MAISNGSFEDAGESLGSAAGWILTAYTSVEVVAAFGEVGYESFDWATGTDALVADAALWVSLSFGLVPALTETFAVGWATDIYLYELIDGIAEYAEFGEGVVEAFEEGWNNDSEYSRVFDHQPHDTWDISPETWTIGAFIRAFDSVARDTFVFGDPTTLAAESFEDEAWPALDQL